MNGFLTGITPFAGPRRAQFGQLYIGGSDHNNFFGKIACARAYEGSCPDFTGGGQSWPFQPTFTLTPIQPLDVIGYPSAQFGAQYLEHHLPE